MRWVFILEKDISLYLDRNNGIESWTVIPHIVTVNVHVKHLFVQKLGVRVIIYDANNHL